MRFFSRIEYLSSISELHENHSFLIFSGYDSNCLTVSEVISGLENAQTDYRGHHVVNTYHQK